MSLSFGQCQLFCPSCSTPVIFFFSKNSSYSYHIGLKPTDFTHTGYNNIYIFFFKLIILVLFWYFPLFAQYIFILLHLWCSQLNMTSQQKMSYTFLIMLPNIGFNLFIKLFSFSWHRFCICFWTWLIEGLIDLSLCSLVSEWTLPKWFTNNVFFYFT